MKRSNDEHDLQSIFNNAPSALAAELLNRVLSGQAQTINLTSDQITPDLLAAMHQLAEQSEGERAEIARQLTQTLLGLYDQLYDPETPTQFQDDVQRAKQAEEVYLSTRDVAALDRAINAWLHILNDSTFVESSEDFCLSILNDAASTFMHRYLETRILADLHQALEFWQHLVESTTPEFVAHYKYLANLGAGLHERHRLASGDMADLEEAIVLLEQAIASMPPYALDKTTVFTNLGNALQSRYIYCGDLLDLELALHYHQQATHTIPPDSPKRPIYLNNLANSLSECYTHSQDLADLEKAVQYLCEARDSVSPDSVYRGPILNNLSINLRKLYTHRGRLTDLEEAIQSAQQIVDGTSTNTSITADALHNLAVGLHHRYVHSQKLSDLDKAIDYFREAVQHIPSNSPNLPMYLNNLAASLHRRCEHMQSPEDFSQAIDFYKNACEYGRTTNLQETLRASVNWGNWSFKRQSWVEAAKSYLYGIETMEQLYQRQLNRSHKEIWLQEARHLYAQTAYAQAMSGQLERAVTSLEHGRAFLLSERLERERSDLNRLIALGYADLHKRYAHCLNQILVLENQTKVDAEHVQAIRTELDEAIGQIQQIPGYEDFLHPPTFAEDVMEATRPLNI